LNYRNSTLAALIQSHHAYSLMLTFTSTSFRAFRYRLGRSPDRVPSLQRYPFVPSKRSRHQIVAPRMPDGLSFIEFQRTSHPLILITSSSLSPRNAIGLSKRVGGVVGDATRRLNSPASELTFPGIPVTGLPADNTRPQNSPPPEPIPPVEIRILNFEIAH